MSVTTRKFTFPDALYIQACSNEVQKRGLLGILGPENREGRFNEKTNKTEAVSCSNKDMGNLNLKIDDTATKRQSTTHQVNACTYDGTVTYWSYPWAKNCDKISTMQFWRDLLGNIKRVASYMIHTPHTKLIFVLVSHHHRIRKLIIPVRPLSNGRKTGFANASAVTISHSGSTNSIHLSRGGDITAHKVYDYLDKSINMRDTILDLSADNWLDYIYTQLGDITENIDIVICRHGEALHNGDDKVKRYLLSPLDPCLTTKGVKQSQELGSDIADAILQSRASDVVVVPIASYLNRSQHTVLNCMAVVAGKLGYDFAKNKKQRKLLDEFQKINTDRYKRLVRQKEETRQEMSRVKSSESL
jgi:broad specificity phosphatase PhoE